MSFDENNLTDQNILCYYAYSRLYTGDTDKRRDLLRGKCADPVYVTFVRSISDVYEECTATHVCWDNYVLGQHDSYVPVPLPVNIATSCSPYAQSAVNVERVAPDHITVSASMTAMRVHEDADPPPCDEYMYLSESDGNDLQGRIMGGRTYTVEVSPLVSGDGAVRSGLA